MSLLIWVLFAALAFVESCVRGFAHLMSSCDDGEESAHLDEGTLYLMLAGLFCLFIIWSSTLLHVAVGCAVILVTVVAMGVVSLRAKHRDRLGA